MRDQIRATLVCSVAVVLLGTLAACTRSAPSVSSSFEVPARVAQANTQAVQDEDMPVVVITASRSDNDGANVLAGETPKARRL